MFRKFALILFVLLMPMQHASASCNSYWNEGVRHNHMGVKYVEQANKHFTEAKRLAALGSANPDPICEKLIEARMASWRAGKKFNKAIRSWQKAYMQCYDSNETEAKRNKRLNEKNLESQKEFVAKMTKTLQSLCGKQSVLPDYKQ